MLIVQCPRCAVSIDLREGQSVTALICPRCGAQVHSLPVDTETIVVTSGDTRAILKGIDKILQPPQSPDEIGRLGQFRILEVIGAGGMGVVFRAEDPKLGRLVAVKAIHPSVLNDAAAAQRFLREARAMARVENSHVVPIYKVDEADGVPYFAMELLSGESLDARLRREPILPAAEIVRIGKEIAEGLSALHSIGLVHRDIKSGNIWLEGPRSTVKLLDFGLARPEAGDAKITESGMIIGTPAFMAPEQTRGQEADVRTDLFALGVVLYRMSTGRMPFEEKDAVATLVAIASKTPVAPRKLNKSLSPLLESIIQKLLAKAACDRFQTGVEVCSALENVDTTLASRRRSTRAAVRGLAIMIFVGLVVFVGLRFYDAFSPTASLSPEPPLTTEKEITPPPIVAQKGAPKDPPEDSQPKPQTPHISEILLSNDYSWSAPESLGPEINDGRSPCMCPTLTDDERILVFSRANKLHIARRDNRDQPFRAAQPLPAPISDIAGRTASLSGDGLLLAITRPIQNIDEDVYLCQRTSVDEPFGEPLLLPSAVNSPSFQRSPVLSPDGLTLLLSTFARGHGNVVQFVRKDRKANFYEVDLQGPVNTADYDIPEWISHDGRVLIATMKVKYPFEARIFVRVNKDAPFGPPQNFKGLDFNPGRPWISPDGARMYFHSREFSGVGSEPSLWMCRRTRNAKKN